MYKDIVSRQTCKLIVRQKALKPISDQSAEAPEHFPARKQESIIAESRLPVPQSDRTACHLPFQTSFRSFSNSFFLPKRAGKERVPQLRHHRFETICAPHRVQQSGRLAASVRTAPRVQVRLEVSGISIQLSTCDS